jgi:glucose/arabinose dehydrogenase
MLKFSCLIIIAGYVLAGCGEPPPGRGAGETERSPGGEVTFRVETVASGLEVPWAIAFDPEGRMFFTERPGRIRIIENGTLRSEPLATLSDVESSGETGLMGLALHPEFSTNRFVYVAYAYASGGKRVRVIRLREGKGALADPVTIIENLPAARFHAGTALGFGPDRKLYITTGDATDRALAQRLDSLAGKTLRLNADGSIPPDNPFSNQASARAEIWSLGHRNSQGLDWQPGTGVMFQTEHGPSGFDGPGGGDEVNIVEKGKNFGWPIIHHKESRDGFESPLLEFTPAVAPASAMFYKGSAFPEMRNNFLFCTLKGECLVRVVLDGRRAVQQQRLLERKYGRLRAITEGPDGAIYFSTSNRDGRGNRASDDDRILRLVPSR